MTSFQFISDEFGVGTVGLAVGDSLWIGSYHADRLGRHFMKSFTKIYGRRFSVTEGAATDTDGDGFNDEVDVCPQVADISQLDTDADGLGNACDLDDDNDGVADIDDAFPLDLSEASDADLDGVGDNADADDNNDGLADIFSSLTDTDSATTQLNKTDVGDQIHAAMAPLPNDTFVLVWEDRSDNDGDRGGIFGQLFDKNFAAIGEEFLVNTAIGDWQTRPSVASQADGTFLVTWHEANSWVRGQLFDTDATKIGTPFQLRDGFNFTGEVIRAQGGGYWAINSATQNPGYLTKLAADGSIESSTAFSSDIVPETPNGAQLSNGNVLVAWHRSNDATGKDVYGQIIDADGNMVGESFMLNSSSTGDQSLVSAAGLSGGGFVAAWQGPDDSGADAVFAQVFDNSGVGQGEFQVSSADTGGTGAFVLANADGSFMVGWEGASQVYVQAYNASGVAQGDAMAISNDGEWVLNTPSNIALIQLSNGQHVAAWDAKYYDRKIFGRIFNRVHANVETALYFSSTTQKLNTTDSGDQINPAVAALPNNRFVVSWSDRSGADGSSGGIFAQLYNGDFSKIGEEFQVNTYTTGWQTRSQVSAAANGNFMITWQQPSVEARLFNSAGTALGDQFNVQPGFNYTSDLAVDGSDNFWTATAVTNDQGYLSKYSATGALLVEKVPFGGDEVVSDPDVTALNDGRILVTWFEGANTAGSDIYGQIFSASGVAAGDRFMINSTTASVQSNTSVTGLSDGGFVAVWQSFGQDGDLYGIFGQRYNASGEKAGAEFQVNAVAVANQTYPHVIANSNGGFVVGWASTHQTPAVYVQAYDANGDEVGDNRVVSADGEMTVNNSVNIEFSQLSGGDFIVAWDAWSGSRNIYARRFAINAGSGLDSDGDGFLDSADLCPQVANEDQLDTDGDGLGNACDSDDDNDWIADGSDPFPLDLQESFDTDQDGIGDYADRDDNNDGVLDVYPAEDSLFSYSTLMNKTTGGDQINAELAALPDSRFVVVWEDRAANDGDRGGIFGRLYDKDLTPLGGEFLVNTLIGDWQTRPRVISNANGEFIVLWHEANGYVSAQVFDTDATPVGEQFNVFTGSNFDVQGTADANGLFWVVTSTVANSGKMAAYRADGSIALSGISFGGAITPYNPHITVLADGQLLVGWHDGETVDSKVYGQVFSTDGVAQGDPIVLNTTAATEKSMVAVAGLARGGFVAAWPVQKADNSLAVYAQVFDANLVGQGEFQVNDSNSDAIKPVVHANSSGGFAVGWQSTVGSTHVYGRAYAPDLTPYGDIVSISFDGQSTLNNSQSLALVQLTNGDFVGAWDAWSGSRNIYARNARLSLVADSDGDGITDPLDLCPSASSLSSVLANNPDIESDIQRFEYCADGDAKQLIFNIEVSDNIDTDKQLSLLFWLQNNQQTWITLPYNATTSSYRLDHQLNQYAADGSYNVRAIVFHDKQGNSIRLNESQIQELGFGTTAVMSNPEADNIAPSVTEVTTNGWTINDNNQPQITFELVARDDVSGLDAGDVIVELLSPTGTSLQKRTSFDEQGAASATFTLSAYSASGDYPVNSVRIYDLAGNSSFGRSYIEANDLVFNLDNPLSDAQAPSLTSFSLSAEFDSEAQRPIIKITGDLLDEVSGNANVYLRLTRPSGGILDKWVTQAASQPGADSFANEIALTTQFLAGKYSVGFLRLQDVAGNQVSFSATDLANLSDDFSTYVNVYFPAEQDVLTGTTTVSGSDENDFVFGADASADSVTTGGGDDFVYTGGGDDVVDAGEGNDTIIGGSGEGNDIYNGGEGVDRVIYTSASAPIVVDLALGTASGDDIDNDVLNSIEEIEAGRGADILRGNADNNVLLGNSGDDTLVASMGADTLAGGEGSDTYVYTSVMESSFAAMDTLQLDAQDKIQLAVVGAVLPVIEDAGSFSTLESAMTAIESSYTNALVTFSVGNTGYFSVQAPTQTDLHGLLVQVNDVSLLSFEGVPSLGELGNTSSNLPLEDKDSDGVIDIVDALPDNPSEVMDSDGDGVGDNSDAFPNDASESADTDGDGMGDNFEFANGLDLNSADDAQADKDGDGVSNFDEFKAGTDVSFDEQAPVFAQAILPEIVLYATSRYIDIDFDSVIANDAKDGEIEATVDLDGPFKSGSYSLTWTAKDAAGNSAQATQTLTVLPSAYVTPLVKAKEGSDVELVVNLTGAAPSYPVKVPLVFSGTASEGSDFIASSQVVEIIDGLSGSVTLTLTDDGQAEGDERIEVSLQMPQGAGLTPFDTTTIVVFEQPTAPVVTLRAAQGELANTLSVSQQGGNVDLNAFVKDVNGTHTYDWSISDSRVVLVDKDQDNLKVFDPSNLPVGFYDLSVAVSDSELPGETFVATLKLQVVSGEVEPDSDADGIPDILDAYEEPNILQASIIEDPSAFLIESDPGGKLLLGGTARSSGNDALIEEEDIEAQFGKDDASYDYGGGIFDFVVSDLPDVGQTYRIVLPQLAAVPANATYRKFINGGWREFVVDADNRVASAPGGFGYCPPPGDDAYRDGLNAGDYCVMLTIEDGGPNDADGVNNGAIVDPGGIASISEQLPNLSAALAGLENKAFEDGDGEQATMAFTLTADADNVVINSLTIEVDGELVVNSDVSAMALYHDRNGDGLAQASEQISSASPASTVTFTLSESLALPEGSSDFIVTFTF